MIDRIAGLWLPARRAGTVADFRATPVTSSGAPPERAGVVTGAGPGSSSEADGGTVDAERSRTLSHGDSVATPQGGATIPTESPTHVNPDRSAAP